LDGDSSIIPINKVNIFFQLQIPVKKVRSMKNQATTKVSFLTRILGKLSIRQRLLLIVIIIYIPLMIMGYNIYKDTTAKVDYVSLELEGSRAVKLLSLFNNKVAIHRGLSAKFLGGDKTSETLSSLSRLATELDELDSEIEKTGKGLSLKLNIQAQWDKLAKEWKRIKNNFKSFEPSENYESHTKLIADILSMISGLGDTSGLILDPDYDTFYLMDLAIYKLPYLSENMGKTRAFGVKLLSQKKAEAEETEKMLFMLQDVISYERFSKDSFDLARKYNPEVSILKKEEIDKILEVEENYIAIVKREILLPKQLTMSPADYFTAASNAINPTFEINQKIADLLVAKLMFKTEAGKKSLYFLYSLLAMCFLGTILLSLFLTNSITAQIRTLVDTVNIFADNVREGNLSFVMAQENAGKDFKEIPPAVNNLVESMLAPITESAKVMTEMAKGNLSEYVLGDYKGDHAEIKDALNRTLDSFNEVIGSLTVAVREMQNGAGQISEASQSLAQGASEQAASVEEISAAITQLSSQTKQAATNAKRASELSSEALTNSHKGGEMMNELMTAMGQIKSASDNISKILKAIDEIAFQTNLLSLNAAVEAARAGKHGKGFAVVAEEVKRLSDRSAKAARETADLISESIVRANNGVGIAEKTMKSLSEISESVEEVAKLMGEVVVASEEQAGGLAEVEKSIQQIEEVTQNNASNSEETASSSTELAGQAESISELVSNFKIKNEFLENVRGKQVHTKTTKKEGQNGSQKAIHDKGHLRKKINPESVISLEDKEFGEY